MTLRERFTDEMKTAMRAKDQPRLDAIRLIMAKLKDSDIASRTADNQNGIEDAQILSMLQGMVKSRRESIELFQKGGREQLAAQEQGEIEVIQSFLPQQLGAGETRAAITAAIAEIGATSVKDMGKVIGVLKGKYAGQIDFSSVSPLVKELLG